MIRKLSIVASILAATLLFSFGRALAQASFPIPFSATPGNWSGQGSATFAVCYNADFSAFVDCDAAANTVFVSLVEVIQQTIGSNGNGCATITTTQSAEFPFPPFPAHVFNVIQTSKNNSYNPVTGSGTATTTNYPAGSGTYCNGSVLVNTAGALPEGTATATFAISQLGKHSNVVAQTAHVEPISYIDNAVGSGYLNRQ